MKTYLKPEHFVDLFWNLFERKMESIHTKTASQCDKILWSLFKSYEKDIKENLEGAFYGIEDYEGDEASSWIGFQFHKSFRQVDVIQDKHIDVVIWMCLQDAPMFWKCMNKACKILVNENAAELYEDEVW